MGEKHIFTRQEWLEACAKLLPNLTQEQREALYRDAFETEKRDPYLEGLLKSDR